MIIYVIWWSSLLISRQVQIWGNWGQLNDHWSVQRGWWLEGRCLSWKVLVFAFKVFVFKVFAFKVFVIKVFAKYYCNFQILEARTLLCHRTPEEIAGWAPPQRGYIGERIYTVEHLWIDFDILLMSLQWRFSTRGWTGMEESKLRQNLKFRQDFPFFQPIPVQPL